MEYKLELLGANAVLGKITHFNSELFFTACDTIEQTLAPDLLDGVARREGCDELWAIK